MSSSEPMSSAEVIAAFQEGRLEGTAFVQALLQAPRFIVPCTPTEGGGVIGTLRDEHGTRWLTIYTDDEALAEAREVDRIDFLGGLMMDLSGRAAVALLAPGDGLQINPDTSRALHYKPHQVGMLKDALHTHDITSALDRASVEGVDDDTLRELGRYQDFRIVVRTRAGVAVPDLAPDAKRRRLLAAFTDQEATDTYLARHRGDPGVVVLSGEELALKLSELDILGVVFNCAGPGRPRALHASLGVRIREAMAAETERR
ncbi:MAG: hypothetical protein ACI8S6_000671 [Myxococcota bacterium]|jgi:hypothetical protein